MRLEEKDSDDEVGRRAMDDDARPRPAAGRRAAARSARPTCRHAALGRIDHSLRSPARSKNLPPMPHDFGAATPQQQQVSPTWHKVTC